MTSLSSANYPPDCLRKRSSDGSENLQPAGRRNSATRRTPSKIPEYAEEENHPIAQLLPVKWLDESELRLSPEAFRLTDRGQSETALFLDPSSDRNQQLWRYLPLPGWVAPTEALPGTEVFLEATVDKEKHDFESVPLLVARTAGAGRVLYAGFDGTWRWRFEVGDKYHQRYWNQLASWIMEKPFAVRDDFVAIDPGASAYQPGESALCVSASGTEKASP